MPRRQPDKLHLFSTQLTTSRETCRLKNVEVILQFHIFIVFKYKKSFAVCSSPLLLPSKYFNFVFYLEMHLSIRWQLDDLSESVSLRLRRQSAGQRDVALHNGRLRHEQVRRHDDVHCRPIGAQRHVPASSQ
jgi:hypothetical protein